MPTAIILAGPNGSGKTTFASAYFRGETGPLAFVNADEIAHQLDPELTGAARDVRAGRLMLDRLDQVVGRLGDFVVETTLSSNLYARRIGPWKVAGYQVALIYIRLASADESSARVQRRKNAGGHGVAETDLRRRFARSLDLLERVYKPMVDDWSVFESREGRFDLVDWRSR